MARERWCGLYLNAGWVEVGRVNRASIAEARVFEAWRNFQAALKRTIEPLTEEQLGLRLRPDLRSVGEIAEHIAYGRALWMRNIQPESTADLEPLVAEVLAGLDASWARLSAYLMRGSADDEYSEADGERLYTIWGMIDHDLPHGGEISLILGAHGLPALDL
jgi:uncharacterized damage-inducible protein DinB